MKGFLIAIGLSTIIIFSGGSLFLSSSNPMTHASYLNASTIRSPLNGSILTKQYTYPGELIGIPQNYTILNTTLLASQSMNKMRFAFSAIQLKTGNVTSDVYVLLVQGKLRNYTFSSGTILLSHGNKPTKSFEKAETDVYVKNVNDSISKNYSNLLEFKAQSNVKISTYLKELHNYILEVSDQTRVNSSKHMFFAISSKILITETEIFKTTLREYNKKVDSTAVGTVKFVRLDYTVVCATTGTLSAYYIIDGGYAYGSISGTFSSYNVFSQRTGTVETYIGFSGSISVFNTATVAANTGLPYSSCSYTLTAGIGSVSCSQETSNTAFFYMGGDASWNAEASSQMVVSPPSSVQVNVAGSTSAQTATLSTC